MTNLECGSNEWPEKTRKSLKQPLKTLSGKGQMCGPLVKPLGKKHFLSYLFSKSKLKLLEEEKEVNKAFWQIEAFVRCTILLLYGAIHN